MIDGGDDVVDGLPAWEVLSICYEMYTLELVNSRA